MRDREKERERDRKRELLGRKVSKKDKIREIL